MDNLSLLIYTNQSYLPIAHLCAEQINENLNNFKIDKYIASNSFNSNVNFDDLDFKLIDTNIGFSENSHHFSEVLIKSLEEIKTDYVLLFLDDYLIINKIKTDVLSNLVNVMVDEKIDYLSLTSLNYPEWGILNINYDKYQLPKDLLLNFNYAYFHMFSVQPSIWKRESLINILKHNIGVSVHDFDTTKVKNIKGETRIQESFEYWLTPPNFWDYNYKFVCLKQTELTKCYNFDDRGLEGDYLLFLYSEIIRWGKFNLNTHQNNRIFLESYLSKKNIDINNEVYKQFF